MLNMIRNVKQKTCKWNLLWSECEIRLKFELSFELPLLKFWIFEDAKIFGLHEEDFLFRQSTHSQVQDIQLYSSSCQEYISSKCLGECFMDQRRASIKSDVIFYSEAQNILNIFSVERWGDSFFRNFMRVIVVSPKCFINGRSPFKIQRVKLNKNLALYLILLLRHVVYIFLSKPEFEQ